MKSRKRLERTVRRRVGREHTNNMGGPYGIEIDKLSQNYTKKNVVRQ
jgi:hypothetical protein